MQHALWKKPPAATVKSAMSSRITVSVVSHGQGDLVHQVLQDLQRLAHPGLDVLLTVNIPENLPFTASAFSFPLEITANPRPQGFGANHNAAARRAGGAYFCVLNPDIRFPLDPFPALLQALNAETGVVAPRVVNPEGADEDHARPFPTAAGILAKAVLGRRGYDAGPHPDWVAGMFMLLRTDTFRAAGGFDERYFLYYEDVDLCARLRAAGLGVTVVPRVRVVHAARRSSHRRLRYLAWHLASLLRFLATPPRCLPPLA